MNKTWYFCGILSGILCGILSGILCGILSSSSQAIPRDGKLLNTKLILNKPFNFYKLSNGFQEV